MRLKKAMVFGMSGVIALALSAGAVYALPATNAAPTVPDMAFKAHGEFKGCKGKGFMGVWQQIPAMLSMDAAQLKEQLKSGKSIAQIAAEKGIAKNDLVGKIQTAMEANLDQAVKDQKLTADKAAQIKNKLPQMVEKMVTRIRNEK